MYNTQKLQEIRTQVSQIKELRDQILGGENSIKKAASMFVSKEHYDTFTSSVSNGFQEFLIEYCDDKVKTNPRWAYYAYKCKGTDPKVLSHYKFEAIKDIPWKHTLAVIALSTIINLAFQGIDRTLILKPAIITTGYFFCAYVITTVSLVTINCCTNAKSLFKNMAIAMILLNFMINIANT